MAPVDRVKEEILAKADILEIVSHYLQLKLQGGRHFGLCPFHKEKSPSFTVSPERQFFHCFGCHKSGNVIDFVMEMEHFTYAEARRYLAQKLSIRMEESGSRKVQHQETDRYQVMDTAIQLYAKWLQEDLKACEYLRSRGLEPASVQKFGLGLAPDRWDALYQALKQRKFPDAVQVELGLVIARPKGDGYYDRFRHRIMFPIRNTLGRVIAFGGRALNPEEPAKYLNSNDTSLFNKSRVLYLLDRAKDTIKSLGVIIVEGYMDAISLHVAGFTQVVASLGTALTKDHVAILRRYTQEFTLLYDGDTAGINAAKRGVEIFFESGLSVRVVLLPEGMDPDDYVRKQGAAALQKLLDSASDGFDFTLSEVLKTINPSTPKGKSEIVKQMLPLLSRIQEVYIRQEYIRHLAQRIGSEVSQLETSVNQVLKKGIYRKTLNQIVEEPILRNQKPTGPYRILKESLLRLLAYHQGLFPQAKNDFNPRLEIFTQSEIQELIPSLLQWLHEDDPIDLLIFKVLQAPQEIGKSSIIRLESLFPEKKDYTEFITIIESEPLPPDLQKDHDKVMESLHWAAEKLQQADLLRCNTQDYKKVLQAFDEIHFRRKS